MADQSKWLKRYSLYEIIALLHRHQDYVVALEDGAEPAGLAIGIPKDDGETVHIAFIVTFVDGAMEKFQKLLQKLYPNATQISYLRRHSLQYTPISDLHRMKALRRTTTLQNAVTN
jgi:hypothetical protein